MCGHKNITMELDTFVGIKISLWNHIYMCGHTNITMESYIHVWVYTYHYGIINHYTSSIV